MKLRVPRGENAQVETQLADGNILAHVHRSSIVFAGGMSAGVSRNDAPFCLDLPGGNAFNDALLWLWECLCNQQVRL